MRAAICDMVTVARMLNLTLVVPELDKTSFWADPSDFEDIFDVRHFIDSLRDEIRIIKRLPKKFTRKYGYQPLEMPPVSWSSEKYYMEQILPLFGKNKVIHFNRTDTISRKEYSEGIIVQEFRRGFLLGDQLLRPETVKVSAGPGKKKYSTVVKEPTEQSAAAAGVDDSSQLESSDIDTSWRRLGNTNITLAVLLNYVYQGPLVDELERSHDDKKPKVDDAMESSIAQAKSWSTS